MKARVLYSSHITNENKLEALDNLHHEYLSYTRVCCKKMIDDKKVSLSLKERTTAYFPKSYKLSSHLMRGAWADISSIFSSWCKALYTRKLKHIIRKSDLSDKQKIQLRCIGKHLITSPKQFGKCNITQDMIDLYYSWVWDAKISGNPPSISDNFPIYLSSFAGQLHKSKTSNHFEFWIYVSCLNHGKRIKIPLEYSPYLANSDKFRKTIIARKKLGRWVFDMFEDSPKPILKGDAGKVGIDVGLNTIAATSDGRLYGQGLKPKFDRVYNTVKQVRANRQRQNLKYNSIRLDKLEQRLSGMVKTETGRIANKLVKTFPDHTFVIEDLDLRGCRGQKRFAYKALHKALESKAVVEKVSPAFTSTLCPSCGYVSKHNRDGVEFHCRSCGRKSHADVIGGINLLRRSEDKQVNAEDYTSAVKTILMKRYLERRNSYRDSSLRVDNESLRLDQKLTTRVSKEADIVSNVPEII